MESDSDHSSEASQDNKKTNNLFRSEFKDVLVKAGEDVYCLHRLKLALHSEFLEKKLMHYWNELHNVPIEIPIDSDTFSSIVDVIYGHQSWKDIFNIENYVSLLNAKAFLLIRHYPNGFYEFLCDYLEDPPKPMSHMKVFELLNFIVDNENVENSLRHVYMHLSENLEDYENLEEFLSLPFDHFSRIISREFNHVYKRSIISRICAKWICHDLANRLPYLVKIGNAARRGQCFIYEIDCPCVEIELCSAIEKTKRRIVEEYIDRMLYEGPIYTVINSNNSVLPNDEYEFNSEEVETASENECKAKLKEYLENGDFYDITVRVDGKVYKLHRIMLKSESEYFEELFSTEYAEATAQSKDLPSLPNKDKEYVIEGIDVTTFDLILDYIYFDEEIQQSSNNMVRVFKAVSILKISDLLCNEYELKSAYREFIKLDHKDIMDILDFTNDKIQNKNLHKRLAKYIGKFVLTMECQTAFYSISWNTLKYCLLSQDFYFDDPQQILDICSKWIMHDVKNRYKLISKVALAINCYGLPDFKDDDIETTSDLNSCSEQSIRDKLWEILHSTSLIPKDTLPNVEHRNLEDGPVFVRISENDLLDVLNANFEQLTTIKFIKSCFHFSRYPLSATLVNDNLFLYYCFSNRSIDDNSSRKERNVSHFLAWNIPSNKFIALSTDSRIKEKCTLVNCRNEVYCYSSDGSVLKYSVPLNRWMRVSRPMGVKNKTWVTSDGEKLYRMYQVPRGCGCWDDCDHKRKYNVKVQVFDFEQKWWTSLPDLPSRIPGSIAIRERGAIFHYLKISGGITSSLMMKTTRTTLKLNIQLLLKLETKFYKYLKVKCTVILIRVRAGN